MLVALSKDTTENYKNVKDVLDLTQVQEKSQTDT